MILSYHPCFEGDKNILCAGREPDESDLAAIKGAHAVILPQGCRLSLYEMARAHCKNIFPNYDARFSYPGKIGQIRLFQETKAPHPKTRTYLTVQDVFNSASLPPLAKRGGFLPQNALFTVAIPPFDNGGDEFLPQNAFFTAAIPPAPFDKGGDNQQLATCNLRPAPCALQPSPCALPLVFKFNWGGEGDNVFLIKDAQAFEEIIQRAAAFEKTGQKGFLIQEYIPYQNRTLRVVIIGEQIISYWRVQESPENFCTNLSKGAVIDADADPDLQTKAAASLKDFCRKTGINLAGFDFLFASDPRSEYEMNTPLFLEINYFFGRSGLGGSERFYELLNAEITRWIQTL